MSSNKQTQKSSKSTSSVANITRRNFIISSTTLGSITIGLLSGLTLSSHSASAQVNGENIEEEVALEAGQINSFEITDESSFTVEWEDMSRGGIIDTDISIAKVPPGTSITDLTDSDFEPLSDISIQVSSNNGSKTVQAKDFIENRNQIDVFSNHPDINPDDLSVDIDNPLNNNNDGSNPYIHISRFAIRYRAQAREGNTNNENTMSDPDQQVIEELEVKVNAVLGFGIVFGKAFGVGNN